MLSRDTATFYRAVQRIRYIGTLLALGSRHDAFTAGANADLNDSTVDRLPKLQTSWQLVGAADADFLVSQALPVCNLR
jgi:hypothetical protein